MNNFATLYNRLDETPDINIRVNALVDYLRQASQEDKIWAIAILADKRPSRIISLVQIKAWGLEASELPLWLFEESLKSVGDVVETISLVVPSSDETSDESLLFWLKHIQGLSKMDEEGKKAGVLEAWNLLEPDARFIFNKLVTGGFRTIFPQIVLTTAISKYTGRPIPIIAHQLISAWDPKKINFDDLFKIPKEGEAAIHTYPFFSTHYLETLPNEIGNPEEWWAEYKWDGLRIQLVVREKKIWIWTNGQELITQKIPELESLATLLPNGTVLDGELLGFNANRPMPLKSLLQRLAKKKPSKKILEETPLVFMAYDILEKGGKDVRSMKFYERREMLHQLSIEHENFSSIKISPIFAFETWSELQELLLTARSNNAIGLVLKNKSSTYGEGRLSGAWWKWKVPQLTVKAVLLYAQSGGWSGGESNYTFAVWEGEQLVPLTKTMEGLTKAEITEISSFVKKNTIERFGPVRSVKPVHVFELIFDTIDISTRHKCGVVLRNPSVLKWKRDTDIKEANSLLEVKEFLNVNE